MNLIIPIPLFQEKIIYCIPSIRTVIHVWNYYSNIRIPTPCGVRTGVTERLLAFDSLCSYWTSSSILQVFSNIYLTTCTTIVSRCLLDSYCHCGGRTGVFKHECQKWNNLFGIIRLITVFYGKSCQTSHLGAACSSGCQYMPNQVR